MTGRRPPPILSSYRTTGYNQKFFALHACIGLKVGYNRGMKDQMTFEEFSSQLPYIDWYYYMSDDPRAYRAGRDQVQHYRDLAIAMGGEWQGAFKNEEEKHPAP